MLHCNSSKLLTLAWIDGSDGLKGEIGLKEFLWSLENGDRPFLRMLIGISSISEDEDDEVLD